MLSDRDAELTILGMALADRQTAEKLAALPQDTFTGSDTQSVYLGIKRVIENHGTPDVVTVKTACMEMGCDPDNTALVRMLGSITTANYGQYETILLNLRKRRLLMKACSDLTAHVADISEDVDSLAGRVLDVIRDTGEKPTSVTAAEAMISLMGHIEKGVGKGIGTGVAGLDRKLGGFKPKQLIVLGARPGVGKTALAIYIAQHVALHSGPVLVVSLEMDSEQIVTRIIAKESGVDVQKLDSCSLKDEDWPAVWFESKRISEMQMRITTSATTPLQVRREAQAMIRDGGLKMIVIDYIQLMRADSPAKSRYEEITQISRELKLMTMDLGVPILALTQFNRESEGKNGTKKRKPTMAEAKDSGSIEQDANVFMTLYPPEEPKAGTEAHDHWQLCQDKGTEWMLLSIDKNRQGPCGYVSLSFDKPHMDFLTIDPV